MTKLGFIRAQLTHRPLRTSLAIGSFALTAFMFVSTYTLLERTRVVPSGFPSPRVIVMSDGPWRLALAQVEQVKRLPGVTDVEWNRFFLTKADTGLDQPAWAATDGFPFTYPKSLLSIPKEAGDAWLHDRQGVITTKKIADARNWKIGSPVTLNLRSGIQGGPSKTTTVTGNFVGYTEGDTNVTIFHANHILPMLADPAAISRMTVGCASAKCENLPQSIDQLFETSDAPTYTMQQLAFYEMNLQEASTMPDLFAIAGAIVFALGVVMTAMTLSISLRERSSELATMRAIGFQRRTVFGLLAGESMLTGLLGGIVGAVPPFVISQLHPVTINAMDANVGMVLSGLVVSPQVAAIGVGLASLVGLFVCVLPAMRSLRQSVVEGLGD